MRGDGGDRTRDADAVGAHRHRDRLAVLVERGEAFEPAAQRSVPLLSRETVERVVQQPGRRVEVDLEVQRGASRPGLEIREQVVALELRS